MSDESEIGELRTKDYGILKIKDHLSIDMALTILKTLKEKAERDQK